MSFGVLLLLIVGLIAAEVGLISDVAAMAVDGMGLVALVLIFFGWLRDRRKPGATRARIFLPRKSRDPAANQLTDD